MANTVAITAPSPTLQSFGGGNAVITAPSPLLFSTVSASTNGVAATAPMGTLTMNGGGYATAAAPSPTLVASGTVTALATATLAAPSPTLSASGTVNAVAQFNLTAPMGKLVGYTGALISVTTPVGTLTASGTSGSIGSATLTAPLFDLTASGTRQNFGSAILTAPMGTLGNGAVAYLIAPGYQLTAVGTATVAVTYEAYALNLNHTPRREDPQPVDELTHYTNYPFDRIVRYKNSYFGMNSTGLFLLEGTTDFAEPTPTPVPWNYKTAMTDFNSVKMKNVSMVYFGGRMAPNATVTAYVGEGTVDAYSYTTPRDTTAQNYRQPLGLGMKARYYAFGASGAGELTLDSITLDVNELARKV